MNNKNVLDFFFELGQLKRVRHEGWRFIGVDEPKSVAEHGLRAAQIAFVLAKMEKYNKPEEACAMAVFHDMAETRIGDITKIGNRYLKKDEERAVREQVEKLGETGKEILELWKQAEYKSTKAGVIAKDADLLEQAVSAKEYMEKGYKFAEDWINNISEKLIQTKSAKKLLKDLRKANSNNWWQGLKKF